jgi:hypothetical protein
VTAARPTLRLVEAPVVEAAPALCAVVRCDRLAVAIAADCVIRLVLADEVTTRTVEGVRFVRAGALEARGWPLAALLEVDAATEAWVFVRGAGGAPVALGTGPCLAVRPLRPPHPLPQGLFRRSRAAVIGAFRVDDGLRERGVSIVGVWIDPARLVGGRS